MKGSPLDATAAWTVLDALMGDPRVQFLDEPPAVMRELRRITEPGKADPNLWADAYLAAFAHCSGVPIVTFDRDFLKFGIDVHLLQ